MAVFFCFLNDVCLCQWWRLCRVMRGFATFGGKHRIIATKGSNIILSVAKNIISRSDTPFDKYPILWYNNNREVILWKFTVLNEYGQVPFSFISKSITVLLVTANSSLQKLLKLSIQNLKKRRILIFHQAMDIWLEMSNLFGQNSNVWIATTPTQ